MAEWLWHVVCFSTPNKYYTVILRSIQAQDTISYFHWFENQWVFAYGFESPYSHARLFDSLYGPEFDFGGDDVVEVDKCILVGKVASRFP